MNVPRPDRSSFAYPAYMVRPPFRTTMQPNGALTDRMPPMPEMVVVVIVPLDVFVPVPIKNRLVEINGSAIVRVAPSAIWVL